MTLLSLSNFTYAGVESHIVPHYIHPEEKTPLVDNGYHFVLPPTHLHSWIEQCEERESDHSSEILGDIKELKYPNQFERLTGFE